MPTPRDRIIAAAAQVFGRKGFKSATVREICQVARVNLAAMNGSSGAGDRALPGRCRARDRS
jgi:hypothetical protein